LTAKRTESQLNPWRFAGAAHRSRSRPVQPGILAPQMASSERSRVTRITDTLYLRMRDRRAWSSASAEPLGPERGFELLRGHKYCLLTTFRKSGEPVPTPVWFGLAGDRLYFHSAADAGKITRMKADSRVRVAPCDARGKPLGAPLQGSARVLAAGEVAEAERAIASNYGLGRRLYERVGSLLSRPQSAYVEVVPAEPASPGGVVSGRS
jgi:PPOX class probable F420-dependent enzyme